MFCIKSCQKFANLLLPCKDAGKITPPKNKQKKPKKTQKQTKMTYQKMSKRKLTVI